MQVENFQGFQTEILLLELEWSSQINEPVSQLIPEAVQGQGRAVQLAPGVKRESEVSLYSLADSWQIALIYLKMPQLQLNFL